MENCTNCLKPSSICLCASIVPQKSAHQVLILQHPQEPDKILGSARLLNLCVENSILRVGLSWANLTKALGEPAIPSEWAVLYLGGKQKVDGAFCVLNKKKEIISNQRGLNLKGVILLDGTWSQAKALWWRNPWLTKLNRIILQPKSPSLYKHLRKEPRRECLSTIEAAAEVLEHIESNFEAAEYLRKTFSEMLNKARK